MLFLLFLGLAQASCLVQRACAVTQTVVLLLWTIVGVLCTFSSQTGASFTSLDHVVRPTLVTLLVHTSVLWRHPAEMLSSLIFTIIVSRCSNLWLICIVGTTMNVLILLWQQQQQVTTTVVAANSTAAAAAVQHCGHYYYTTSTTTTTITTTATSVIYRINIGPIKCRAPTSTRSSLLEDAA